MLSVTEKKVSDLIDLAYESALDPKEDGWKLFYEQFAKLVSGRGGCLAVYDKADSSFREIARIHDPAIEEELNSTYYSLIPWRAELESLIPGEAFIRRRDFPDHIFVSSDIYRAFFERHGVFQFIHQKIHDDEKFSLSIGFTWPMEHADLDGDAKAALESIFPHVRRATDLYLNHLRADRDNDLLKRAIAELDPAILMVTAAGRITMANPHGERILSECVDMLRDRHGGIALRTPASTRQLRKRIWEVAEGAADPNSTGDEFTITDAAGTAVLDVRFKRIEPSGVLGIPDEPLVLIELRSFFQKTDSPRKDLKRIYGLTPAEQRLAMMIAEGHSLAEACAILNVSANTARTHLKRIFSKTDTHRQSSLVRLILSK